MSVRASLRPKPSWEAPQDRSGEPSDPFATFSPSLVSPGLILASPVGGWTPQVLYPTPSHAPSGSSGVLLRAGYLGQTATAPPCRLVATIGTLTMTTAAQRTPSAAARAARPGGGRPARRRGIFGRSFATPLVTWLYITLPHVSPWL